MVTENMNERTTENIPLSSELVSLLDFTKDVLSKELPTLTIDLEYFILSIFSHKQNLIYKRLENCLVSSTIEVIYESFYKRVSAKALSAIKSNRKINFDEELENFLKQGENEYEKI